MSPPLPPSPTGHPPGSPGKLKVMEERAAAGYALWHPDDFGMRPQRVSEVLRELLHGKPPVPTTGIAPPDPTG